MQSRIFLKDIYSASPDQIATIVKGATLEEIQNLGLVLHLIVNGVIPIEEQVWPTLKENTLKHLQSNFEPTTFAFPWPSQDTEEKITTLKGSTFETG